MTSMKTTIPTLLRLTVSGLGWGALAGTIVGSAIGLCFGLLILFTGSPSALGLIVIGAIVGVLLGAPIGLFAGVSSGLIMTVLIRIGPSPRAAATTTIGIVLVLLAILLFHVTDWCVILGIPAIGLYPLVRIVTRAVRPVSGPVGSPAEGSVYA